MKPKKILVATDFSPAAERAIRRAAALARHFNAELRVIHVMPPRRWLQGMFGSKQQWVELAHGQASAALKAQAERALGDGGVELSTGLVTGKASAAIAAAVSQFDADLLVVGAHGEGSTEGAQVRLGNTALKLMRSIEVPLLLARLDDVCPLGRVLAAVDLSATSKDVVNWAAAMAGNDGLTVIHVFEPPFADRLRGYGVSKKAIDVYTGGQQAELERALKSTLAKANAPKSCKKLVLRGDAVRSITVQLRKLKIDTLVMGKHSKRKRDAAAPFGSVCRYLADSAPTNVLIVP